MIITLISTIVLPLEYAIYLGILSTILIFLDESSRMNLNYIVEGEDGQFIELPMESIKKSEPKIVIINIEGDLYFAAAEDLQDKIQQILKTNLKVLILRFRRTHLLASTGIIVLEQLIRIARKNDVHVLFCGIQKEVLQPLQAAGVTDIIGEENVFTADNLLFDSTHRALQAAKTILYQQQAESEGIEDKNNPVNEKSSSNEST